MEAEKMKQVSLIILAGGSSRRMGREKADLLLGDETFLTHQAHTGETLGVGEILVSGYAGVCRWPVVTDTSPACGPLGGISACLAAAANPVCLVLAVDAPLVPPALLRALAERLLEDERLEVVLARAEGRAQPLIAAYRKSLAPRMEALLRGGAVPVWRFLDRCSLDYVEAAQPELLANCNTPQEYEALCAVLKK